jgi:hypothetical protein
MDSDTLVMPVWIGALQPGISGTGSGQNSRITYGIVTFGQFSADPVDSAGFDNSFNLDGSLTADVLNPGLAVYGSWDGNGSPLLYNDMPSTSLTMRRDATSYAADHGMGALMVHFQNAVGNKAQVVSLVDHHNLTVTKDGTGTGSVTSTPAGIDCGSTCTSSFGIGDQVTLTATPDSGSNFTGWTGGGCSGTGTCVVTISADTTVTATFTKKAKDKTKPSVTSLKVKVNHKKKMATVKFKGTDPGHGSKGLRFKCKLDKKPFKSCKSPKTYKHLHKGKHKVQVKVIDKAGNVSKARTKKFKV